MFHLATFFLALCTVFTVASATPVKYVEIRSPFANIYEQLDPKSTLVQQAKKGDHLELVFEGTSWFKVKTKEKEGWVEKRAGQIVDHAKTGYGTLPLIIGFVLLAGTFGGASFYIYSQKTKEA